MIEYPKIETLFDRNPERMKEIIPGKLRKPEFAFVDKWHVTEKLDGTNVRIMYNGGADPRVQFRGRSDNAKMIEREYQWLHGRFPASLFENAFDLAGPSAVKFTCTLYGEFYGPKIQSGGWYRSDYGYRVFDVRIGDWWLDWDNIEDVCRKLGVQTVPVLATNVNLEAAISLVKVSSVTASLEGGEASRHHEGIIARTNPDLYMKDGRRLMWKLKVRDLPANWEER